MAPNNNSRSSSKSSSDSQPPHRGRRREVRTTSSNPNPPQQDLRPLAGSGYAPQLQQNSPLGSGVPYSSTGPGPDQMQSSTTRAISSGQSRNSSPSTVTGSKSPPPPSYQSSWVLPDMVIPGPPEVYRTYPPRQAPSRNERSGRDRQGGAVAVTGNLRASAPSGDAHRPRNPNPSKTLIPTLRPSSSWEMLYLEARRDTAVEVHRHVRYQKQCENDYEAMYAEARRHDPDQP